MDPEEAAAAAAAEGGEAPASGEGTTPEEVRSIMKTAGAELPAEPGEGEEEGDDPDKKPAAGEEEGDDPDKKPAAGDDEKPAGDEGEEETDEQREAREAEEAKAAEEEEAAVAKAEEERKAAAEKPADDLAAELDEKYAFEIEDGNGQTFKIVPGATMEEILAEFEPKNNGQIIDILNKLQKAEADKASDLREAEATTMKAELDERIANYQKGWDSEVTDLTAQKRIPEGKEGEERVAEVYKFMNEENGKRIEAKRPTIGSFEDALDKLEAQEAREAKVAEAKAEKDETRRKGGMVGGSSAPATGKAKPYVAGSARNANEAIQQAGLLNS